MKTGAWRRQCLNSFRLYGDIGMDKVFTSEYAPGHAGVPYYSVSTLEAFEKQRAYHFALGEALRR